MDADANLETYWITFPCNPNLPWGIGVTAYSEEDAFSLIEDRGFDRRYEGASKIQITSGIAFEDLDKSNVAPNIGPMQFRGVWYPAANIGFGAPRDLVFKRFSVKKNPMTKGDAIALIESELASDNTDDLDIVITEIRSLAWGWVVFYNTRKFTETHDFRDGLAGNAPYLVDAKTGAITVTGTALPVEDCIKDYERDNGY